MQYTKLGSSNLKISRACLGTMTWGLQNTQADADQQIEYCLERGINFIDTAEIYPVMPTEATYGHTESIIGDWLSRNPARRKEFVLASKMAGNGVPYVRGGASLTGNDVMSSIDASLKRLQTESIELYQLHWPNRPSPRFSRHWTNDFRSSDVNKQEHSDNMLGMLEALNKAIQAGKIQFIGLSNETPWGLNEYLKLSEKHNLPRIVSMQNEFSLLHANDNPLLLENCAIEDVAYLPWSPLAGGALTGKYSRGIPEGSRWSREQRHGIFRDTDLVHKAVAEYTELAQKNNMTPGQLALRWCNQVDGVTSSIFGATTMDQLKENVTAFNEELSEDLMADVLEIFKKYPIPF